MKDRAETLGRTTQLQIPWSARVGIQQVKMSAEAAGAIRLGAQWAGRLPVNVFVEGLGDGLIVHHNDDGEENQQ